MLLVIILISIHEYVIHIPPDDVKNESNRGEALSQLSNESQMGKAFNLILKQGGAYLRSLNFMLFISFLFKAKAIKIGEF